jgi:hypothetical protein
MVAAPLRVAITGGARGIGLATALAFQAAGATVTIGDLEPAGAPETLAALPLDVRSAASFADFVAAVGPLDVLVNNAGVATSTSFLTTPAPLRDLQIDVNLRGVVNGMAAVLPGMVERGHGHVVNVASLAGRIPTPNASVYTATKHAVVGLTEAVRAELRGTGVRLTAVLPTFAVTDMTRGLALRGVPMTTPDAVAGAVVRAVRRGGPAVAAVPRWLGVAPRLAAWTPQFVKDLLTSWSAGDPLTRENPERAGYAARVQGQLEHPSPE